LRRAGGDDGIERFSVASDRLSAFCLLEEDEPFVFDGDLPDDF
jgi:hypothetical protein